jgi:hypothetical protein
MKRALLILGMMSAIPIIYLNADAKGSGPGYQTATVVSVEKHQTPSNYLGDNPADAPLQARDYSYDIGFRLDCDVYVGRYHSAINYLPSGFARNKNVEVRLQKHVMYIGLPDNDWDVKIGIIGHRHVRDESCRANS